MAVLFTSVITWLIICPSVYSLRFNGSGLRFSQIEDAVSEAVRDYMADESSLGFVTPHGYSGVTGRSIGLPLAVYDSSTLISLCSYDPFSERFLEFRPGEDVAGAMKARFRNLHGHRVRAQLFPLGISADTLMINDSTSIRGGPDATLRWALEAHFNLTFDVSRPRDGVLTGYVRNGTYHGSLADCIYKHVDINLVVKMVKWYETDRIQLLSLRLYGWLVVVVRRHGRLRGWRVVNYLSQY